MNVFNFEIRAFRAVDDIPSCELFAAGHAKVLLDYGVTKVTSSSTAWFHNPAVYVIIVKNLDTEEIAGGVRVHIADGITPLPLEDAISIVDERIFDLVRSHIPNRTAELCGLWNAKSTAGLGLGSYVLMRAGISLATQLNLSSLFALCAPHTLQISVEKGFEIEKSIGNEGTFIYPKLDLIATSIIIRDVDSLPMALENERELIWALRENPICFKEEVGAKSTLRIYYNLAL